MINLNVKLFCSQYYISVIKSMNIWTAIKFHIYNILIIKKNFYCLIKFYALSSNGFSKKSMSHKISRKINSGTKSLIYLPYSFCQSMKLVFFSFFSSGCCRFFLVFELSAQATKLFFGVGLNSNSHARLCFVALLSDQFKSLNNAWITFESWTLKICNRRSPEIRVRLLDNFGSIIN